MTKKIKWINGDIFLVPLLDSTWVVGQIVHVAEDLKTPMCAFFDLKKVSQEEVIGGDELKSENLIALQFVTRDSLSSGYWKIMRNAPVFDFSSFLDITPVLVNDYIGINI